MTMSSLKNHHPNPHHHHHTTNHHHNHHQQPPQHPQQQQQHQTTTTTTATNKEEIFHAILTSNLEQLKKLVTPENVNIKDRSGYTLLHIATNNEKTEIAKWLVSVAGADINMHCNSHTVLSTALNKGNFDLFDFYLENKAECIGRNQLNVLHEAANKNRYDIVERLIEKGADPNLFNNVHITPLTIAINHKNKEIILLLLENGACANLPDKKGNTALHLACSLCDSEIIQTLLENTECDLKLKNLNEETGLDLLWLNAIKDNKIIDQDLVDKLVSSGACFSMPWNYNLNVNNYSIFLKIISHLCKYRLKDLFLNDKPFFTDLILNGYWKNSITIAIKSAILDSKQQQQNTKKSDLIKSIEIIFLSNEFNIKHNDLLATLYMSEEDQDETTTTSGDDQTTTSQTNDLFKFIKSFLSKPLSLKYLCRTEIRKNLIDLNNDTLSKLKLNDTNLIKFLKFELIHLNSNNNKS